MIEMVTAEADYKVNGTNFPGSLTKTGPSQSLEKDSSNVLKWSLIFS